MSAQEMRITALSDQSWAAIASHATEIERIAETGCECQDDAGIVRMVLCHTLAELAMRRHRLLAGNEP